MFCQENINHPDGESK